MLVKFLGSLILDIRKNIKMQENPREALLTVFILKLRTYMNVFCVNDYVKENSAMQKRKENSKKR